MSAGAEAKLRREAHAEWLWMACLDGRPEAASLKFIAEHHRSFEVRDRARAMHDTLKDRRETLCQKRRRNISTNAPARETELVLAVLRELVRRQERGAPYQTIRVPRDTLPLSAGAPSFVVLFDSGRCLHVMLKRRGNRLTAKQEAFREAALGLGHQYALIEASTLDEARSAVVALVEHSPERPTGQSPSSRRKGASGGQ